MYTTDNEDDDNDHDAQAGDSTSNHGKRKFNIKIDSNQYIVTCTGDTMQQESSDNTSSDELIGSGACKFTTEGIKLNHRSSTSPCVCQQIHILIRS